LKLPRYQVMAFEMLASLLLDVDLPRRALEASQRALAVADTTRIEFWRVRTEASEAIARLRLGDLSVGPALHDALTRARETGERTHMVRCLEGMAELALRRRELHGCESVGAQMLALAAGAGMIELAARGQLWRGEALAALGQRDAAIEQLGLAAAGAEKLGRIWLAARAREALARVSGDPAHRSQAAAFTDRLENGARDCERLMAAL
jgi:hypothetical protein